MFVRNDFFPECGNYNYIFYAHDVVGNFLNLLKDKNVTAKTVCYGDALGQLFDKSTHLGLINKEGRIRSLLKRLKGDKDAQIPDYAVLTIPVSQIKMNRRSKLIVPDRSLAQSVLEKCRTNIQVIAEYAKELKSSIKDKNSYLFMTENIAEGCFMSFENEMDFYKDILEQNCPQGATIIVKPHPGEQIDRTKYFEEHLGKNYHFIKFDPSLKRYPIELFYDLLKECTVISMFYPVLSLKYLYDMSVIQPMTNLVIEKYFASSLWDSYKNAIELNMAPLGRLENWDGKSLLYEGR